MIKTECITKDFKSTLRIDIDLEEVQDYVALHGNCTKAIEAICKSLHNDIFELVNK